MALNKIKTGSITDAAVEKEKIKADAVDATKIADDAISEEHLDNTAITGHAELSATAADDDVLLIFDTSSGTMKKIAASNVGVLAATLTSITPTNVNTGDGSGNATFTITGKNFTVGTTAFLINSSGTEINFDTLTRNSSTQLTGVIAISSIPGSGEPYDVRVVVANGTQATLRDQVNINQQPVFVTAAGSLGTGRGNDVERFTVNATDPESAGNVTFELQSGTLPPGLSLSNEGSEGGTAVISGTATDPVSNTTYNFVLRAVDAASNTSSRAFSILIERDITFQSFTSSGTFAVPAGTTALNQLLVVAGGGGAVGIHSPEPVHGPGTGAGGAGGLVYMPCYPVSPGGTITVTIGCGGRAGPGVPWSTDAGGQDTTFGSPGDPGLGQGGVITAKGGGSGGYSYGNNNSTALGKAGGSGGGGGYSPGGGQGGTANQPTQPGNSGAYGFGNPGGVGQGYNTAKGGGGGAGAAGAPGACGSTGGIGKAYTIADGTTPVYYAGGGGGSGPGGAVSAGGQGGGSASANASYTGPSSGGWPGAPTNVAGEPGQGTANRGGGGGGVNNSGSPGWPSAYNVGNNGGKGVVIVAY